MHAPYEVNDDVHIKRKKDYIPNRESLVLEVRTFELIS